MTRSWRGAVVGLAVMLATASGQDLKPDDPAALVDLLVKGGERGPLYAARGLLERRLSEPGAGADDTARLLLARLHDVVPEGAARQRIEALARDGHAVDAAALLLGILAARPQLATTPGGAIVVGRVTTSDGKLDPDLVLAQMAISERGLFACEVKDLQQPLTFRAPGYADRAVKLDGQPGAIIDLGTVTLEPLPKDQTAGLKGKVAPDGGLGTDPVKVMVSLQVPKPNTVHGGVSPRRRWPEPVEAKVSPTGDFELAGLNPADYYVSVSARNHRAASTRLTLEPGKVADAGTIALRSSDLGFYIGKEAPKAPALAWVKDYAAAAEQAKTDRKPMMVMLTATWCGPCKMLESETLDNVWIRSFLSDFVIVKAFEEKAVEEKYGNVQGYPTLVFTTPDGKEAARVVGYRPSLDFAAQLLKAYRALGHAVPEPLQQLEAKHVLSEKS